MFNADAQFVPRLHFFRAQRAPVKFGGFGVAFEREAESRVSVRGSNRTRERKSRASLTQSFSSNFAVLFFASRSRFKCPALSAYKI